MGQAGSAGSSAEFADSCLWNEVVKKRKRVAKKHLVVKFMDKTHKATEKNNEISLVPKGTVILNFESEHQRDEAAAKVEELENLSANKTKMLFPKIMICNVSKEENGDDIVQTTWNILRTLQIR